MIYNVFYTTDKMIAWASTGQMNSEIIALEAERGFSHLEIERDDHIDANRHMVNADGTDIIERSTYSPTFSTITPALEATVNVTGLVVGTKVYVDNVLKATMTDTTLNLTFNDPGTFIVEFKKADHLDYKQKIIVARQS